MIEHLLTTPCVIVRREDGTEDDYGNVIPAESTVNTVCAFQRQATSEDRSQNNLAESGWNVFLRADEDVESGDAVIVDGQEYEVDGDPWKVRNELTGQVSHVEVQVKRVAGSGDGGS